MKDRKYYSDILNVREDASQNEIKRAYHRLARKHHPDVNVADPFAKDRFQVISEAYEYLSSTPYVPQAPSLPQVRTESAPPAVKLDYRTLPDITLTAIGQNQTAATYALAIAIAFAAATLLFLFRSPSSNSGIAHTLDRSFSSVSETIPKPGSDAFGQYREEMRRDEIIRNLTRTGALGNIIRVDQKTGKCPKHSYPATYDKKAKHFAQLCLRKFIDTDTIVEDVKLLGAGAACQTGYSMQGSITVDKTSQAICVKTAFPQNSGRVVLKLYESDEKAGCEPRHEMVGVEEGLGKPGRRKIICQALASL